jgi:hypothetical protein
VKCSVNAESVSFDDSLHAGAEQVTPPERASISPSDAARRFSGANSGGPPRDGACARPVRLP